MSGGSAPERQHVIYDLRSPREAWCAVTGGETRFIEPIERTITPRRGSALVFQHKLRHEGCVVQKGHKYAMRSDLIYEADLPLRMPGG